MNDYVLLRFDGDERVLVLGMRWHTILGSRLGQRARQKAREAKASHHAHAPGSEAVGVIRLNRADRGLADQLHSGALAFASDHRQGVVALRAELPDGRIWVVAVQGGKVLTHSDRVHDSAADAQAALDGLMAHHGDELVILDADPGDLGEASLPAFLGDASDACRLQPCGWSMPAIPRPLVVAALGCAAAFLLRSGWDWYRHQEGGSTPAQPGIDPEAAWAQVYEALRQRIRLHAESDGLAVLDALADLPAEVGGWRLSSAQCSRGTEQGWTCRARYDRRHRLATNASFLGARPSGWSETWQPMDAVVARFAVADGAQPLEPSRLMSRAEHDGKTITALQQVLPLMSGATLGETVPVRLEPPRDEYGAAMAAPPSMPAVSERPLVLEGPLRSMFLIPGLLANQVEWRAVSLTVDAAAELSLNRSRLMAGMSGVLYARD
ncbi:type 4b pilus protein PilO2 [Pigmentiphaga kullae]|uniref:Pilin accessory protein (PilO) n=1 Tax=Pigmentiphaga kullae TaxID=151784 RepID=A0A4Q7NN81_9BURK|nr:type 4b pilus protein PilO2 [Pigmentiphaga kullae]RZS86522.1 pilin accessory protein (PilO) [Pigmentiphaga kullae]